MSKAVVVQYGGDFDPKKIYSAISDFMIEHNGRAPTFNDMLAILDLAPTKRSTLAHVLSKMKMAGLFENVKGEYRVPGTWTPKPAPRIFSISEKTDVN